MNIVKRFFGTKDKSELDAVNKLIGDTIRTSWEKLFANMFANIGLKGTTIPKADNFDFVHNGYMKVPYAYEIISKITNKIASCPVVIYEVKDESKARKYKSMPLGADPLTLATLKAQAFLEVEDKKIRSLIERPNDKQSWSDFIRMTATMLLATGNAFIYHLSGDSRSRKVTEMWALPFRPGKDGMKIVSGGMFEPIEGYSIRWGENKELDFTPNEITHVKLTNPMWELDGSGLYGMSPLHAYVAQLVRYDYGGEAVNQLLKNGFKMGLITPRHKEDAFSAEQKKGLKEALVSALKSKEAFSRFVPSSIAMDYIPIGLDSTEMGVNDLFKLDREDVYRAYGASPLLASTDASTYNNEETVSRKFIYDSVAPFADIISEALTKMICEPYIKADSKKYIIKIDVSSLPELAADQKKLSEWLDKAKELTPNEKREVRGWGRLDGIPGMDEPIYSKNDVPISMIATGRTLNSNVNSNDSENKD